MAVDWSELLAIVEERVKPERMKLGDNGDARRRKEKWWLWGRYTPALFSAVAGLERVLIISMVGQQAAFAFLPPNMVYAESTIVFPLVSYGAFCILQSRPHETWVRFFGSSLEDRLRYTPSDCFETFPFPVGGETHPALESTGQAYYELRAALMVRNDKGMTETYNRFRDPYEKDPEIERLRELHGDMDRAVLDAYGWTDVPIDCNFLLDYEIDEPTWGRKKKPYRYRWPDTIRDEVLARLLALNAERAAEEARSSAASQTPRQTSPSKSARPRSREPSASQPTLSRVEPKPLLPSLDDQTDNSISRPTRLRKASHHRWPITSRSPFQSDSSFIRTTEEKGDRSEIQ